jgi:hypothetical protein
LGASAGMPWCGSRLAKFGDGLEVNHDGGYSLCVVLPLSEDVGAQVVTFGAQGDAGGQSVVDAQAGGDFEAIFAPESGLGNHVDAAREDVQPGLEARATPGNLCAASIA